MLFKSFIHSSVYPTQQEETSPINEDLQGNEKSLINKLEPEQDTPQPTDGKAATCNESGNDPQQPEEQEHLLKNVEENESKKDKELIEFSPDQSRNIPVEGAATERPVSPKGNDANTQSPKPGNVPGASNQKEEESAQPVAKSLSKPKAPSPVGKWVVWFTQKWLILIAIF